MTANQRLIACVGTGQMSPGIAQTCAMAGYQALVIGRSEEGLARARARITANLAAMQPYGLIDDAGVAALWSGLSFATRYEALADADIVVEGVTEDLALKQKLFPELEQHCRPDAILLSTTSAMRASDIARDMARPERMLVAHYWNPPHLLQCVEVAPGAKTDPAVTDIVMRFLRSTDHKPVLCRIEAAGFIANRLQHAMWREALAIVERGIATAEEVDEAMKTSFGARTPVLGIFEHLDLVGARTTYAIHQFLLADLDAQTGPNRILQEKIDAGETGSAVGKGFYDWSTKSAKDVLQARDTLLLELARKRKHAA